MGRLKLFLKEASLKKSLMTIVFVMILAVVMLSALTMLTCNAIQNWLVPIRDEVMLHVYVQNADGTVSENVMRMRTNGERSDNSLFIQGDTENTSPSIIGYAIVPIASPEFLSPKKMLLYRTMDVCIYALPFLYALAGIVLSALLFYRKRMAQPLAVLSGGVRRIADRDLDFSIHLDRNDELGLLCDAFETMRVALLEAQRESWALIEEQRQLTASVAHDIRTPVTIIEGYAQLIRDNAPNHQLSASQYRESLDHIVGACARLRRYADSVRDIQNLNDLPLQKRTVALAETVQPLNAEMAVLASGFGKRLVIAGNDCSDVTVQLDAAVFGRVLENLTANAARYAKETVQLRYSLHNDTLQIKVCDDGSGFSAKALESATIPFYRESGPEEHTGLGLAICKTLCRKHGGNLAIGNAPAGGACVTATFSIK